jgi:Ca2+/Na+ antiporter
MFVIGIFAGVTGLCFVPVLLRHLFCDKEPLVSLLSIVVASAVFFCSRVVFTQVSGGVFVAYLGVVLINICTTVGYRHERKDGGKDKRFSAKNNPFIEGLFSGAMWRAIIAMAITYVY